MGKEVTVKTEVTTEDIKVVEYLADGYTMMEIGEKIKKPPRSVQAVIDKLKNQFQCPNVTNLAVTFIRKKIIE